MRNKLVLIVFLLSAISLFPQEKVSIISSSNSEIVFSYKPKFSKFEKNNSGIFEYDVNGTQLHPFVQKNQSKLLVKYLTLGVPSFGSKIQILDVKEKQYSGKLEITSQLDENKENGNVVQTDWVVKFDEGISRGVYKEGFIIYPIRKIDEKSFKKLEEITFKIIYNNKNIDHISFEDDLLKRSLLNYSVAKNWGIKNQKLGKSTPSVLSYGVWYRTKITEVGIFKIDYSTLTSIGFNPSVDNPKTIKIYNNGGYALPEVNSTVRPDDLVENAIEVVGEDDGVLNSSDYVIFYGQGTDVFEGDSFGRISRKHNPFSQGNYYWITWGGSEGKRIESVNSLTNFDVEQTTTKAYLFHENDNFNVLKSGRLFLGEEFSVNQKSRSFSLDFTDIVPNSNININYSFANLSENSVYLNFYLNDFQIKSQYLSGYGSTSYTVGRLTSSNFDTQVNSTNTTQDLELYFSANSSSQSGALNYFEVEFEKELNAKNNFLLFYSPNLTSDVKYSISNFSSNGIKIFDVSDYANVKYILANNIQNGSADIIVDELSYNISKYIATTSSNFKSITNFESVENSNVRGNNANSKLIVITNKMFQSAVDEYIQYRQGESKNQISSSVFYQDEIFNEFSAGQTDPTAIRDFVKHAYNNWDIKPEHIFLVGKGTYDYYGIDENQNNFLISYHTNESLNSVNSYFTDDYFVWVDGDDEQVDLSVARLPVETEDEFQIFFNKIKEYENNQDFSNWRYKITLVADDHIVPSGTDPAQHTKQSEQLSLEIPKYFEQNKIYLIQYPTEVTGVGRRKPLVNQAITDAINNGTLLINFIGHGSADVWTDERVFMSDVTIPQLENSNYFFLTAATCSFGKIDDPDRKAATEQLIFKPEAGAIGVFASTRASYSDPNYYLNEKFYNSLLDSRDSEGSASLGSAFFTAKYTYSINNTEKFTLVSDPALRLLEPNATSQIDSVNGFDLSNNVQIKALSNMRIKGSVDNQPNFNGEALITVFDSKRRIELPEINNFMYQEGGVLFKGRVSVTDGHFQTDFIVPQDISYENLNGKIIAYFYNDELDGIGGSTNIVVGGLDTTQTNDGKGPDIEIAFDNFEFNGAFLVNPDFTFLARLQDATGINTSGLGLGHRLEGIIDGDEENPINFTNSFVSDLNESGKSGEINYKFYNIDEGNHSIKLKTWDVFNNPSEAIAEFNVVNGDGLIIKYVVNYPNPFSESTYFTFQHNLNESVDVEIRIFTVAGRKIKQIEERSVFDKFVKIPWDGKDEDGNEIANGTYFYKLKVKSISGDYTESFVGKLSVIK